MPDIELLTIGTELLLGFTIDTNSAELGRALAGAGFTVVRRTSVTDVASRLQDAGIISYARGIITVLDFDKLKQISCECYDTLRVPELA